MHRQFPPTCFFQEANLPDAFSRLPDSFFQTGKVRLTISRHVSKLKHAAGHFSPAQ